MKTSLIYVLFVLFFIASCAKSSENNIPVKLESPKVFYPVTILGGPGNWGGGVCSWGFIMIREDSNSIVYHSITIPAVNPPIPNIPTSIKIQFHDTVAPVSNCWRSIVVDSIKY